MSQEITVSKTGINAGTATDPNDLIYSSKYNTLKHHASGTLNMTLSGAGNIEGTVSHGLGYKPFFISYCNRYSADTAEYNMCPGLYADAGVYDHSMAYADNSNLYFKIFKNFEAGAITRTFKYFIFRNNTGL